MEKEILNFISENKLSPFNKGKTKINSKNSLFKTKEAKAVHNKVLAKISSYFVFPETSNLLNFFQFTEDSSEITKRQEFFKNTLKNLNSEFLNSISTPKVMWKPKYDVLVVTEDEDTFVTLKNKNIPVTFITSENDIYDLQNYDLVQVINCENFTLMLEKLPQTIFLKSLEDVYLERFLEIFSSWKENLRFIENSPFENLNKLSLELKPLLPLLDENPTQNFSREQVEKSLETINEQISEKLKTLTVSGESLYKILDESKIPQQIQDIISATISNSKLPENIFNFKIPVTIDEQELEKTVKTKDANEFTEISETIKSHSEKLKQIPDKLQQLSNLLIYYDFISGVSKFSEGKENFSETSNKFFIEQSKNLFLENPQPVTFNLNENEKCSILTGANSGGKTTLIEHILQLISLSQLGLPISGKIQIPIFSEVYYFAKNKGSFSKGAFETLLTEMSKIKTGDKTLILADEMEAVTEPGAAGKILCATAEYFISKNCFLVIATHLGQEIQEFLPQKTRIDGIEAKGLSEKNELIVNHSPILGKIANSTPELIVERLSKTQKTDYFNYLNNYLKKQDL